MTISSQVRIAGPFFGNDIATVFPFTYKIFLADDLFIIKTNVATGISTTLALTTDYSVSLNADQNVNPGGSITLVVPLASGFSMLMTTDLPYLQLTDLTNSGGFYPKVINDSLDRLTIFCQQLFSLIGRTLKFPLSDTGVNTELPSAVARANNLLGFDSFGNPIAVAPVAGTATALAAALAASTGAGIVGYGAGTVKTGLDSLNSSVASNTAAISANATNIAEARNYNDQTFSTLALMKDRMGDLSGFFDAIGKRAATVVLYGDSILEGVSQVCYEDSWGGILERAIRAQNPGVAWTFINLSLAGRGMGNAFSNTYTGKASPDNAISTNFYHDPVGGATALWPSPSVIGKTWMDHVKDAAPDLVILALGANDTSGDANAFATLIKNLKAYGDSWTKKPSWAVVPTTLPVSTDPTLGPLSENINVNAIATRGVAEELNLTNIDANRMQFLLRDGTDVVNEKYDQEADFYQYPTNWAVISGSPVVASGQLTGVSMIQRRRLARNTRINCVFNFANYSTGTPGLWYRVNPANVNLAYVLQVASGTTAILYYNLVAISSTTLTTPLVNGADVVIEVEVVGAHHRAWVNGQKVIDLYDYQALTTGYQNFQIGGSTGVAKFLIMRFGNPTKVGNPKFIEAQLFGAVNDFATNPASLGGDARHHPSKIGHSVLFMPPAAGLMDAIKRAAAPGPIGHVEASTYDTAWVPAVNDYIDLQIDGVTIVGDSLVSGAAGGLNSSTTANKFVAGNRTVVVQILQNATTPRLVTNVVLPVGNWLILAAVSITQNGAGVRHILTASAIRVS